MHGLFSKTRVYVVPVPGSALSAHAAGVDRLMASYRSIPATSAVRLAKPTSNLFRARAKRDHTMYVDPSAVSLVDQRLERRETFNA